MAKRNRRSNKSNSIGVDFSEVESRKTVSEGNHLVVIDSVEQKEGNKAPYLALVFEVSEGKDKGSKIFHNCSLAPQALFNLKALLEALGMNIPKKAFDLDLDTLVGLECIAEVSHELYEGKKKAVVTEFLEADGDSDDEDEDGSEVEELLEDLDEDELIDLAKELGAKAKQLKKLDGEDELIDFIIDNFDEEDIEEALDEEDDEDDETDYEDMSLKELKAEAKSRGIKVKKSMDEEDIIELLEEDDE